MMMKLTLFLSLVSILTSFEGGLASTQAQEPSPAAPEPNAPAASELAGSVCPRYIWMNHGTYYSYYSQKSPTCVPVNYDSTSNSLATTTSCITGGPGCISTFQAREANGAAASETDPGMAGYGAGQPAGNGDKRGRLVRETGNRPWPGQSNRLLVRHVDDFEINFQLPDGATVQAQVMIVKSKIAGSPDTEALLGRGNEILRFNNPRSPSNGTVGEVTPIAGRPHAFECEYKPNGGGDPVRIEIITHHTTAGHGM